MLQARVLIVDDEPAIHAVWKERIRVLPVDSNLTLHHVSTPPQLQEFCTQLSSQLEADSAAGEKKILYLVEIDTLSRIGVIYVVIATDFGA